ncbi:MAG: transcription antitermination factor NusB [Chloroflexota bacterium]|nr:transcription antitermination factor NusB [Chloroflexota bacterium]
MVKVRRRARIVALQTLFEVDIAHHQPERVLLQRLEDTNLPQRGEEFARSLVSGVLKHQERLDPLIREHAPKWPLEQMALIDRNVLRIALFELLVAQSAPVKVIINEAVELAKLFGSDSSYRFINGVLGTLLDHRAQLPDIPSHLEYGERR